MKQWTRYGYSLIVEVTGAMMTVDKWAFSSSGLTTTHGRVLIHLAPARWIKFDPVNAELFYHVHSGTVSSLSVS